MLTHIFQDAPVGQRSTAVNVLTRKSGSRMSSATWSGSAATSGATRSRFSCKQQYNSLLRTLTILDAPQGSSCSSVQMHCNTGAVDRDSISSTKTAARGAVPCQFRAQPHGATWQTDCCRTMKYADLISSITVK